MLGVKEEFGTLIFLSLLSLCNDKSFQLLKFLLPFCLFYCTQFFYYKRDKNFNVFEVRMNQRDEELHYLYQVDYYY